jgi:hypothetical protein
MTSRIVSPFTDATMSFTPHRASPPRDSRFGSPLKLSRVHWGAAGGRR